MLEAPSIDAILRSLEDPLALPPLDSAASYAPQDVLGGDIGLADRAQIPTGRTSKLIGMLFCRPAAKLAAEILPDLPYYHTRSGSFVDFFCAGYGASWPSNDYVDKKPVTRIDDDDWFFSEKAFIDVLKEVEASTQWTYSGQSELLLLAARGNQKKCTVMLDFSTAIVCNLESMQKDGAIASVPALFESIIKFGHDYSGPDPVWEFSDKLGIGQGKGFLKEMLLLLLPEKVRDLYKSASHAAVRDISKKK